MPTTTDWFNAIQLYITLKYKERIDVTFSFYQLKNNPEFESNHQWLENSAIELIMYKIPLSTCKKGLNKLPFSIDKTTITRSITFQHIANVTIYTRHIADAIVR